MLLKPELAKILSPPLREKEGMEEKVKQLEEDREVVAQYLADLLENKAANEDHNRMVMNAFANLDKKIEYLEGVCSFLYGKTVELEKQIETMSKEMVVIQPPSTIKKLN